MSLANFKAQNHPQQTKRRGANDEVDDRETHPENFGPLNERFGFTLDVAAAPHNAKCERFYTREDDGLVQPWAGRVWCNPPYSDVRSWVEKAWHEWNKCGCGRQKNPGSGTCGESDHLFWPLEHSAKPELIVMLLPANRVEQKWWQELVEPLRDMEGSPLRVQFLPGRMRFIRPGAVIGPKGDRPPFGCCLLIWGQG